MHMSERERFQVMMLDHLYGLLEPSEAQELEAYLNSPEGENLRQQGEEWKFRLRRRRQVRISCDAILAAQ